MNQDQAKGKWAQIKGRAKRFWGQLTGNDLTLVEGALEQHHGTIQEKIGNNTEVRKARLQQLP